MTAPRIIGRDDDPGDPIAVSDPRFDRPYDDSDGRAGDYRRTREGWVDLDYDRRWDHVRLEP